MAAKTKADDNPKVLTIYGRLSYANFLYKQALARNATSQFAKADPAEVKPDFNLLVSQDMLDVIKTHVVDVFLPYCLEQSNKGEKRDALDAKQVAQLVKLVESEDWDNQPPYIAIKSVPENTVEMLAKMGDAPVAANIKINGNAGTDIEQRAVVRAEDELVVPDPTRLQYPCILPVNETKHDLYPGSYVGATLNLYAFISGKFPGFSAGASVAVFREDANRFGGGVAVDEEAMFAD